MSTLISSEKRSGDGSFTLRSPRREEGYAIRQLVEQCPPLDVNSTYAYMLLGEHFASTSVVAQDASGIVGLVSAYRHPEKPHVLFVWQVAVHPSARGHGLAGRMLKHILRRPAARSIRYVQTTVGPENAGSRATFARLALLLDTSIQEQAMFGPELFGPGNHEEERLLSIGPFEPLTPRMPAQPQRPARIPDAGRLPAAARPSTYQ
jgi:L-2,4-diaminobutyric acid acetyltransferase